MATMIRSGQVFGPYKRKLNEFDVFIRDYRAVDIYIRELRTNSLIYLSATPLVRCDLRYGFF